MYRQFISRDRAELRASDLTNMQTFANEGQVGLFLDGIGTGQYYSGLTVTQNGPTEVRVAPGRYWKDGQEYARLENLQLGIQAELISLLEYLPSTYDKAIALVVHGESRDTDVEPRDFLIDLVSQVTEPQAVPMHRLRLALVSAIEGTESAQPQLPVIPSGVLHFATVWMQPTGIYRIEMVEENLVPSAEAIKIDLAEFLTWKAGVEAEINNLRSLLAALLELINQFSPLKQLRQLGLDVARVKERVSLPDTYSQYGADWFVTDDETDVTYTGYAARVDNGLLFPTEASAAFNLALLSPSDPNATVVNDLVLPEFTSARRFYTTGYEGQDMGLSAEQQSFEVQSFEVATWQNRYGQSYNAYGAWWSENYLQGADFRQGNRAHSHADKTHYAYNWTLEWNKNWTLAPAEYQYLAPSTTTIIGAMVAQTFLCPAGMWLTEVGLNFTRIDSSGDVSLVVCQTSKTGEPLLNEAISQVTLSHSQLNLYSEETRFAVPPAFLWGGKRYAICIISQGAHRLATVSGAKHTEGTLFTSTSGAWFEGDLTKDLLFSLYAAKFNAPRTVLTLQSASLAGGIADLEIDTPAFIPPGCSLIYEMQVNGDWKPLTDPTYHLASLPDTLPLRAVLVGTRDVMPAIKTATDAIAVSRPALGLTHISTERTLPTATDTFTVKVKVYGYNQTNGQTDHTLVASILDGGTERSASVTSIRHDADGSSLLTFDFTLPSAITAYRIKLTATRANAGVEPFTIVERMDIAV